MWLDASGGVLDGSVIGLERPWIMHKPVCVLWRSRYCMWIVCQHMSKVRRYQCRWCRFSFLFIFLENVMEPHHYHPTSGSPVCLCVSVQVGVWEKKKPCGDLVALSVSLWHHERSLAWNSCWLHLRVAVREETLSKHWENDDFVNKCQTLLVTLSHYDSDGWLEDLIWWSRSSTQ